MAANTHFLKLLSKSTLLDGEVALNSNGRLIAKLGSNEHIFATSTDIDTLTTNLAAEVTLARATEGDLTDLITTDKTNLVAAVNEVQTEVDNLANDAANRYLDKITTDEQVVVAPVTFQNDVVISGNFTVTGVGKKVELTVEELRVSDNNIVLNAGFTGTPTENAGISVARGDAGELTIVEWNETSDAVTVAKYDATLNEGAGGFKQDKVVTKEDLDAEIAARIADVDAEQLARETAVTAEENRAKSVEGDLTNLITVDKTNLVSAINEIQDKVGNNIGELTDLTTDAKENLVAAINEVDLHSDQNASAISQTNTRLGANADLTTTAKDTVVAAINELDADLATEVSRATAAELAEKTRAENAEGVLTTNLAAEATTARAAEVALGGRIDTEITDRTAADAAIKTAVVSEVSRILTAIMSKSGFAVTQDFLANTDTVITNTTGSSDVIVAVYSANGTDLIREEGMFTSISTTDTNITIRSAVNLVGTRVVVVSPIKSITDITLA